MNTDPSPHSPSYPLAELCVLVDLPPRTVRYYVVGPEKFISRVN